MVKKPINADYSALTKKTETNPKHSEFKVNDRVRITKYKYILSEGYTENMSRKIFFTDSVLKTNPWTYKTKKLGRFYEKILLLSKFKMSYYAETDTHIRDLSNSQSLMSK